MSCLFCRIIAGELPATIVYRAEDVIAFRDMNPQAPTHILVIPTRHVASIADTQEGDTGLLGRLITVAKQVAQTEKLNAGYRLVINTGTQGGQTVFHLHVHLLGGRRMTWPPG